MKLFNKLNYKFNLSLSLIALTSLSLSLLNVAQARILMPLPKEVSADKWAKSYARVAQDVRLDLDANVSVIVPDDFRQLPFDGLYFGQNDSGEQVYVALIPKSSFDYDFISNLDKQTVKLVSNPDRRNLTIPAWTNSNFTDNKVFSEFKKPIGKDVNDQHNSIKKSIDDQHNSIKKSIEDQHNSIKKSIEDQHNSIKKSIDSQFKKFDDEFNKNFDKDFVNSRTKWPKDKPQIEELPRELIKRLPFYSEGSYVASFTEQQKALVQRDVLRIPNVRLGILADSGENAATYLTQVNGRPAIAFDAKVMNITREYRGRYQYIYSVAIDYDKNNVLYAVYYYYGDNDLKPRNYRTSQNFLQSLTIGRPNEIKRSRVYPLSTRLPNGELRRVP